MAIAALAERAAGTAVQVKRGSSGGVAPLFPIDLLAVDSGKEAVSCWLVGVGHSKGRIGMLSH